MLSVVAGGSLANHEVGNIAHCRGEFLGAGALRRIIIATSATVPEPQKRPLGGYGDGDASRY